MFEQDLRACEFDDVSKSNDFFKDKTCIESRIRPLLHRPVFSMDAARTEARNGPNWGIICCR